MCAQSVYEHPIGRNRAVPQWIQVQKALDDYAELTQTRLIQAGDPDYDRPTHSATLSRKHTDPVRFSLSLAPEVFVLA